MQDEQPDFRKILDALKSAGVRFVVIGGLAMVAHGTLDFSDDVDICYDRSASNQDCLFAVLAKHKPRLRIPEGQFPLDARTLASNSNLPLVSDIGDVDLLGEIVGTNSFDGLWQRVTEIERFGVPVRVASIDDLISMKKAANRPKDQNHILELEALRKLKRDENL